MSNQPLLSCRQGRDTVQVFLATKWEDSSNPEFYLFGKGNFAGKPVNFQDRNVGTNTWSSASYSSWQMKVRRSIDIELLNLIDNDDSSGFACSQKNVFKVLDSYENYFSYKGDWEESVTKIKLTLGQCQEDTKRRECEIKINEGVGLQFNPEYRPKVILLS